MPDQDSKMQIILDKVEADWKAGETDATIKGLVEAIKLLSRGMKQTMGDLGHTRRSIDDIPIGKT